MKQLFLANGLLAFTAIMTTPAASAADLNGKWNFAVQTEGGERYFAPVFRLDGQTVTGKWGTADVKGTFSGNKLDLSFPFASEEAGAGTLKIVGTMVDGSMAGTWQFDVYQGTFKAIRADAPAMTTTVATSAIAGTWNCEMGADRVFPFTLTLSENAGVWSGKVSSEAGEVLVQAVKVEQGAVTFTIDVNSTIVAFKLKTADDQLEGTWGAGDRSGPIKGVKKAS